MKQTQTRVCVPSFEESCPFNRKQNKNMLRLNRNLSVCLASDGNQSTTEMVCHSPIEENIAIGLTAVCIVINVLHMYILTQIKSQRRSPFFIILWLRTVLNCMISLFHCVSLLCCIRKLFVLTYPILIVFISVISGSLIQTTGFITMFAICERWLMLAKPFEYSEGLFIKKFNWWICLCSIFFVVLNVLTYFVPFFIDNLLCYDSAIGMLYSDSPEVFYIISTPYLLLFICIILAAAFFFAEFNKMRTRLTTGTVATVDMQTTQACNYVFISTILYISVTLFGLLVELFLVLQQPLTVTYGDKFKLWSFLAGLSISATMNVFALCGTLKLYRQKVKIVFHKLIRCRRTFNSTAVHPFLQR